MGYDIRDILQRTAAYLGQAGIAAARLEAELLLGSVLGLDRTQLYVQYDRPVGEHELAALRPLLLRRTKDREPVTYLIGHKSFYGMDLLVPKGVFIPRPETEELVEAIAARAGEKDRAYAILDLCAGSGAVGLALARRLPHSTVLAVDISPAAVAAVTENATRLGVHDRVTAADGDLWAAVPEGRSFHVVVANPPYIPTAAMADLPPEVRDHEPSLALAGGTDGLDVYRRIFADLDRHLLPGGFLGLEHGADQGPQVAALARGAGLAEIESLLDMAGHPRMLLARKGEPARWV